MTVQGRYENLNGLVTSPYNQTQAAMQPITAQGQDIMAANAQMTGQMPLASATVPMAQTNQAMTNPVAYQAPIENSTIAPANNNLQQQPIQMANNPPAPQGCGSNLDCNA